MDPPEPRPALQSLPPLSAHLGEALAHAGIDLDGNPLSWELLEGPPGLTLAPDGALRWLPDQVGGHRAQLRVRDPEGLAATLAWVIEVVRARSVTR